MARAKALGDIVLVHWNDAEARELARALEKAGWKVTVGPGELKALKAKPPAAVVISLRRLPSHGREVADALWYTKWGREIPIVFLDGEADKVAATRRRFPAARFTTWDELPAALAPFAAPAKKGDLWTCPECGERFTTANQWHSCGRFELDALFARSEPHVRRLYDLFVAACEASGPVTVIPQKSRIALQVRMRFAALMPQKTALKGHLVLARRAESPLFENVETFSPRNHVHVFRLESEKQLDAAFRKLVAEAYDVGSQRHLEKKT